MFFKKKKLLSGFISLALDLEFGWLILIYHRYYSRALSGYCTGYTETSSPLPADKLLFTEILMSHKGLTKIK